VTHQKKKKIRKHQKIIEGGNGERAVKSKQIDRNEQETYTFHPDN
jgi:hypothetical protein